MTSVRVDVWLWSIRLTPTRSAATELCRGGHVTVNGTAAKPATPVKVGDRVEARVGQRQRVVEVVRIIHKRVGAPVAAECFVDMSPLVEKIAPPLQRDRGAGRPTKRERREIDRFRHG